MFEFPQPVSRIIAMLNRAGRGAYAVGGCVRDALLSLTPHDWDITTSAQPDQVLACFKGFRVIETGLKHGTVTVLMDGEPFEITTYRRDGAYTDHRRPDSVAFVSSLREDLMRRDFTINAMACHPETGLIDLFGGREDLRRGIIRCVGEPEKRFGEDALRILRALRFASRFDFALDAPTAAAATRLRGTLENVSAERVFEEIKKLLCGAGARRILLAYPEILFQVFPELAPMRGCAQNNPHHAYDVWTHTAIAVASAPADPVSRLTMLFHDSGKPQMRTTDANGVDHFKGHPALSEQIAESALLRMKCDKATLQAVCLRVREHDLRTPANAKCVKREMARLKDTPLEALFPILRADLRGQNPALRDEKEAYVNALEATYREVLAQNACVRIADLQVNGGDMLALGARGPQVGKLLHALLSEVVSETLPNRREDLLARAGALFTAL